MRTLTPTTVHHLTYQATMLASSDYSLSTRTDIQKMYLKGSIARISSGALAEDRKSSTKRGLITVSKAREKIADRVHR